MTDSRAALEERARRCFFHDDIPETQRVETTIEALCDFAEQESSSLKLLLSAMCRVLVDLHPHLHPPSLAITIGHHRKLYRCDFDSSGIPVITPEILEALEAAK